MIRNPFSGATNDLVYVANIVVNNAGAVTNTIEFVNHTGLSPVWSRAIAGVYDSGLAGVFNPLSLHGWSACDFIFADQPGGYWMTETIFTGFAAVRGFDLLVNVYSVVGGVRTLADVPFGITIPVMFYYKP